MGVERRAQLSALVFTPAGAIARGVAHGGTLSDDLHARIRDSVRGSAHDQRTFAVTVTAAESGRAPARRSLNGRNPPGGLRRSVRW